MAARTRSPALAQAVLAATSFLFVFDGLVVNLALPAIQDLHLGFRLLVPLAPAGIVEIALTRPNRASA